MWENGLSSVQHEQIIGAYLVGTKQKIISIQLDISINTVSDTIKWYKKTGSAVPEKHFGWLKLLT